MASRPVISSVSSLTSPLMTAESIATPIKNGPTAVSAAPIMTTSKGSRDRLPHILEVRPHAQEHVTGVSRPFLRPEGHHARPSHACPPLVVQVRVESRRSRRRAGCRAAGRRGVRPRLSSPRRAPGCGRRAMTVETRWAITSEVRPTMSLAPEPLAGRVRSWHPPSSWRRRAAG